MAGSTMAIRPPIAVSKLGQDSGLVREKDDGPVSAPKRRKLDNNGTASISPKGNIVSEPVAAPAVETRPPDKTAVQNTDVKQQMETPSAAILYAPGSVVPKLSKFLDQIVEVRIASKYLSTRNKEVSTRQLWGTDIYTDDSDPVAICQHTGKIMLRPIATQRYPGISAFFRILPGKSQYQGSSRYRIQSRSWTPQYHKCSLELIRIAPIMQGEKLDPRAPGSQLKVPKCVAASGPTRRPYTKRRFSPDTTIMFNLFNEPCLKYYLGLVADRGMDAALWTSTRLQKEVLYLNTNDSQFELARSGNNGQFDTYSWSRCGDVSLPRKVPVPSGQSKVLQDNLDWEEIEWGVSTVTIRSTAYNIMTMKFLPITA